MVKLRNTTGGEITVVELVEKQTTLANEEEMDIDPATVAIAIK